MTPDQYRREGAEAMREAAANEWQHVKVEGGRAMAALLAYEARIRAIDPAELLAKVAWKGPGETPHRYSPDYMAQGDCRICGHTWGAHQPAPDPVARLVEAAKALGAMPEGYCFCRSDRIGDDSKIHEPECANLRSALVAKENEQCQVSTEPVTGATTNGPRGSDAGVPAAVANSHTDSVSRLVEAATAEYFLQPPLQTKEEQMGRRAAVRGMMVRLGNYSKFTSALAAMEARDASEA